MSETKLSRRFYVCETHLNTAQRSFKAPPIKELLNDIILGFTKSEFDSHLLENGKKVYRLRDIKQIDDNHYCILVSMSNEDIPDNVNEEKDTGKLRELTRLENESPALSAHILINVNEVSEGSNLYLTLIENVSRISLSSIVGFLRKISRQTYPEKKEDPVTKKLKVYAPLISFLGYQSTTVANMLNNSGKVSSLKFSTTEILSDGTGEEAYSVEKVKTVELKIKKGLSGVRGIEWIKNGVMSNKDNYEDFRVTIASDDSRNSPTLNTDLQDVTQSCFIKQIEVKDFDSDLKSCEDQIRDDVVEKMLKELSRI